METEECLKSLVTQAMDGSEPWMEAKLWMEASRRLLLSCRVARIVYVLQTYMVQADAEMWQRYVIKHMFHTGQQVRKAIGGRGRMRLLQSRVEVGHFLIFTSCL